MKTLCESPKQTRYWGYKWWISSQNEGVIKIQIFLLIKESTEVNYVLLFYVFLNESSEELPAQPKAWRGERNNTEHVAPDITLGWAVSYCPLRSTTSQHCPIFKIANNLVDGKLEHTRILLP